MIATLRKILAIAAVDIRIEFEDRSTWLFFLILPVVFTALLGLSFAGGGNVAVLVVDEDHGPVAARLVAALSADRGLEPTLVSAADAKTALAASNPPPVLTIPAGFGDGLLAGGHPGLRLDYASETSAVLAARQAVASATDQLGGAVAAARAATAQVEAVRPFADEAARSTYLAAALGQAEELVARPPAATATSTSPNVVQLPTGYGQSSPGELVMWTLITLLGAAEVFVSERLSGTLRRVLITPTRRSTIVVGKIAGRYALGLLQMALLIGIGAAVFHVPWGRSPLALLMVVLSFALMAVALGVLLATISRTRAQASQLMILFSMLLAALGGAWFPLEVTPASFQAVAQVLPTTWAMHGFNEVILRGGGPAAVLPSVAILLGFAAAFLLIAIRRLKLD
jgi:ABC-2 type transport system permease protein